MQKLKKLFIMNLDEIIEFGYRQHISIDIDMSDALHAINYQCKNNKILKDEIKKVLVNIIIKKI
jgi:hypothetical protein